MDPMDYGLVVDSVFKHHGEDSALLVIANRFAQDSVAWVGKKDTTTWSAWARHTTDELIPILFKIDQSRSRSVLKSVLAAGNELPVAPPRSKASLLHSWAEGLLKEQLFAPAADTALSAYRLLATAGDTLNRTAAHLLYITGKATMRGGGVEEGAILLDRCIALAERIADRDLVRRSLAGRMTDLSLTDTAHASLFFRQCLDEARSSQDTLLWCQCLNNRGAFLGANSRLPEAYEQNSAAMALCRSWTTPDPLETVRALGDASTYLSRSSKYLEAAQLLDEIPKLVDMREASAKARITYLLNKGKQWYFYNDFARAFTYSEEALALSNKERFDLEEPKAYLNSAVMYGGMASQTGHALEAIRLLDSVVALQRFNMPVYSSLISALHNNLASAHEQLGNTEKVIEHCKAVRSGSSLGMALPTLMKAYRTAGDNRAADSCLQAYQAAFESQPSQVTRSAYQTSLLNEADRARSEGDWETALDRVNDILTILTGTPMARASLPEFPPGLPTMDQLLVLRAKTESMFHVGMRTNSDTLISASSEMDVRLRPVYDTLFQVRYDPKERNEILEFLAHTASRKISTMLRVPQSERDQVYWLTMLNEMEYQRDRDLSAASSSNITEVERALPSELVEREHELSSILRISLSAGIPSTDLSLAAINDSLESVRHRIRQLEPRYFTLRSHPATLGLEEISSKLGDPRTALVAMHFTGEDSNLVCVVVRSTGITGHAVRISGSRIDSLISDLRGKQSIAENPAPMNGSLLFYDQVIAPIIDAAPTDRLVILADNALTGLPFEALRTGGGAHIADAPSEMLIDKVCIQYATSIRTFLNKIPSTDAEPLAHVGFAPGYAGLQPIRTRGTEIADGDRTRSLGPLAENDEEVEVAADLLGGTAFTGGEASEREFRQVSPDAGLIHLALHGITDEEDAMNNMVLFEEAKSSGGGLASATTDLPDDGLLRFREFYAMRLRANLAVLSACETAIGTVQQGEGVMSMARAFNYAGVPNVVSSLWKVDDLATKEIMVKFYEHLAEGKGKADALAEAKRWYRKEHPEAPPSKWAAFILIGDNEPVHLKKRSPVRPWMIGGGAVALVAIIAIRRRWSKRLAA